MAAALREGAVGRCIGAVAAEVWREEVGVQCYYPALVTVAPCIEHSTAIGFSPVGCVSSGMPDGDTSQAWEDSSARWTTLSMHPLGKI